ncbi:DnaJ/Hsp40 cysteine-rich domain superfamily protein [Hibiscus syriacus]|uniref:DnaJ/Hsp40 cysteine-rich domain superfamily protein n=1 Tax=Hibiscus syriacus TaxID=106335 RepID=A0A6A3CWD7_HIBSY|nr:VQ motif-containing protein 19-like [Hibiscus syriacus]KAE8732817.1 DnaJ/Hsp40 cysteine-rich domain superfamily protein [Hibiscus syriacus]
MEKHLRLNPIPSTQTPTTFVEADANAFKDLVQKLTGFTNDTEKLPVTLSGRVSTKTSSHGGDHPTPPRHPPFKLQERRQLHNMRKLGLATLRNSPSECARFCQALQLESPVTPLGSSESLFYSSSGTVSPSPPAVSEEEKSITKKGFYLHPSTSNTPRGSRLPQLLTLFPLSSPRQEKRD